MSAKLIIEEGSFKGLSFILENGNSWTIGRNSDQCDFVIDDPLIANQHLLIRQTDQGIEIENLSDANPALLNDEVLLQIPRHLETSDRIKIGNEVLCFYDDDAQLEEPFNEEIESDEEIIEDDDEIFEGDWTSEEDSETPKDFEEETDGDASEAVLNDEDFSSDFSDNTKAEELAASLEDSTDPSTARVPEPTSPSPLESLDNDSHNDTIYSEEEDLSHVKLAEIDFGFTETGRWLLKVISGPNNGAEFHMQSEHQYIIGTDPHSCDIVFHDTSVSRQHAKITVSAEDVISIEDLRSRNGVIVEGSIITEPQTLNTNVIVTLGTTSFVIYDREGEMHTIISPILPSLVKSLKQEEEAKNGASKEDDSTIKEYTANYVPTPVQSDNESIATSQQQTQPKEAIEKKPKPKNLTLFIFLACILSFFLLAGLGTLALFKAEPVVKVQQENADELIQKVLDPFPAVRYSFNKSNGALLLIGHVATQNDKTQLLYHLQGLSFIKSIDDSGIVIDEYVWQELNSILARKPAWKGITIHSPNAGEFVLSGYLKTRKESEELSSYMSLNFPYIDLLKKQIIVEEDVLGQVNSWLQIASLTNVTPTISNGILNLNGSIPADKALVLQEVIEKIQQIPGLRQVNNFVKTATPELGRVNISDQYEITGKSRIGNNLTVVINGRVLSEGDNLDGMDITKINSNSVLLEKGDTKYRIDY